MKKLSVQDVDRCVNEKQDSDSGETQNKASSFPTFRVFKDKTENADSDVWYPGIVDQKTLAACLVTAEQIIRDPRPDRLERFRRTKATLIAQVKAHPVSFDEWNAQDTKSGVSPAFSVGAVAGSLPHQTSSESFPSPSVSEAEDKNSGEGSKEHRAVPSTESAIIPKLDTAPSFTKGPWRWTAGLSAWDGNRPLESLPTFNALEGAGGQLVLTGVWCNDGTGVVGVEGDNPAANARLIAAAPALYAALNKSARRVHMSHELHMLHFVTFEECPKESCTEARAALALANTQDTNTLASSGESSPNQ